MTLNVLIFLVLTLVEIYHRTILGVSTIFSRFHWKDSIVLVIVLILPKTAIPIDIVFLSGLTFIHFQGVLQDILVLIFHEVAISSVLHSYTISSDD